MTFRIVFSSHFEPNEFKAIFAYDLGIVQKVETKPATYGNSHGYAYTIHMESLTETGVLFMEMLKSGTQRYCYGDDGYRPLYFICEKLK